MPTRSDQPREAQDGTILPGSQASREPPPWESPPIGSGTFSLDVRWTVRRITRVVGARFALEAERTRDGLQFRHHHAGYGGKRGRFAGLRDAHVGPDAKEDKASSRLRPHSPASR
jgi:hypothetical protein